MLEEKENTLEELKVARRDEFRTGYIQGFHDGVQQGHKEMEPEVSMNYYKDKGFRSRAARHFLDTFAEFDISNMEENEETDPEE